MSKAHALDLDATRYGPRRRFGSRRFVMLDKLTAGEPAELYLAEDRQLRRAVSLKLLHAERNYDAAAAALLEREARLLSRIHHPNVVAAYDLGYFGAELCMTLAPVGRDGLEQWLARRKPSRTAILDILRQAAAGLAAAHSAGVVHGDLTPNRIRIDDRQQVLLVDFDRAEDLTPEPCAWEHGTGPVDINPNYIAPETRANGLRHPLSDQYSFCAIAWEALSGRRPPHDPQQAAQHSYRRDPAYQTLARGLANNPSERWPSMTELITALTHPPAGLARHWSKPWRTALTVLLVLGASLSALSATESGRAILQAATPSDQR